MLKLPIDPIYGKQTRMNRALPFNKVLNILQNSDRTEYIEDMNGESLRKNLSPAENAVLLEIGDKFRPLDGIVAKSHRMVQNNLSLMKRYNENSHEINAHKVEAKKPKGKKQKAKKHTKKRKSKK